MIAVWSETSFTELDLCSILTEEKKDSLQLFFFLRRTHKEARLWISTGNVDIVEEKVIKTLIKN